MIKRTVREAIIEALKRSNSPLSAREIYDHIIKADLYRFNAEVPENIVRVAIRRFCEGVDFPTANPKKYFQILPSGKYWIKDLPVPGGNETSKVKTILKKDSDSLKDIGAQLRQVHLAHTVAFKLQLLNQLKQIDPKIFEVFSKKLLEVYGFEEVKVTSYSKDGGLDGFGKLKVGITHLDVAFQCKRWKNATLGRVEIDRFRGAIQGQYEQGMIFTTSSFSKEALNATRRSGAVPIILIDGNALIDIMIEKKFGIAVDQMPVYVNALDEVLNDDKD